jgi:hypothetical protein
VLQSTMESTAKPGYSSFLISMAVPSRFRLLCFTLSICEDEQTSRMTSSKWGE